MMMIIMLIIIIIQLNSNKKLNYTPYVALKLFVDVDGDWTVNAALN